MIPYEFFEQFKKKIDKKLATLKNNNFHQSINTQVKKDRSPVTVLDHFISQEFHKEVSSLMINIIDEESYENTISFPSFIIDPLDGTKEFINMLPECTVSIAYCESKAVQNQKNWGWIYNPLNYFEIGSGVAQGRDKELLIKEEGKLSAYVSRTEYNNGLYRYIEEDKFHLKAMGSIAYKLGLLCDEMCDFVVSLKPKNIWDIAAGTILLAQKGIYLYERGIEVQELSKMSFQPPLLWCRREQFEEIKKVIK